MSQTHVRRKTCVNKLAEDIEIIDLVSDASDDEIECPLSSRNDTRCQLKSNDRKSSFDRFGDDLTQLILNYLPTEDKFRFECLSRVIRNNIFNKQTRLVISSNEAKKPDSKNPLTIELNLLTTIDEIIETVLKKFVSLTDLEIRGRDLALDQMLRMLADNCLHLRSLTILNAYSSYV